MVIIFISRVDYYNYLCRARSKTGYDTYRSITRPTESIESDGRFRFKG